MTTREFMLETLEKISDISFDVATELEDWNTTNWFEDFKWYMADLNALHIFLSSTKTHLREMLKVHFKEEVDNDSVK